MQGKVEICGVNTSRLKTLKSEEMSQLLRQAREGDQQARNKLVEGNLRLVLSVIQRFMGRGENPDDLFQVGCIGLLKAVQNFDDTKMVRFSTYGVPMIAGEIRRYLRDNSTIRVSRSLRDLAYRILQCKEQLQLQLGREASLEEVAAKLELPIEDVVNAMDAITAPVSLYEPVYSDGGDTIFVMDQIGDKNDEDSWISAILFRDSMAGMNPREKIILSRRFLQGKTQVDVAREIGISQAQVSRLEKNALKKVKQQMS